MGTRQTNEARVCFAEALRLQPNLAKDNLEAGRNLLAQGQLETAIIRLTLAAQLAPDEPEAHESLGLACAQQGKVAEAATEFEQVLRLRPNAQAHYNLALARVMQGRPKEAANHYRRAVELKPDWAVALNDLAWLRATTWQSGLRDGTEAVRLARRACELAGEKEPRFWVTLGAAYAEAGQFDEAVAAAEKACRLAAADGLNDVAGKNRELLELYRQRKPYRESGPEAGSTR